MSHQNDTESQLLTKVSFPRFVGYFLWLGTVGFGGPIALAGHMQQDLVDERGWISKEDYLEGLALAQLAPGPLAAQLAIYLGYIRAEPAGECVRARRHCRRYRGNCGGGGGPGSSLGLRSAHNSDLFAEPRHTVSLENTR